MFLFEKQLPETLEDGFMFREPIFELRNERIKKRNVERNSVLVFNALCLNVAAICLLIATAWQFHCDFVIRTNPSNMFINNVESRICVFSFVREFIQRVIC